MFSCNGCAEYGIMLLPHGLSGICVTKDRDHWHERQRPAALILPQPVLSGFGDPVSGIARGAGMLREAGPLRDCL